MKYLKLFAIISLLLLLGFVILRQPKVIATDYTYAYPGKMPFALDISSNGTILYASGPNGALVIDKATMEVVNEISFGQGFLHADIKANTKHDSNDEYIYYLYNEIANSPGKLGRVNISNAQIETIVLPPGNVFDFTYDEI